MEKLYKYMSAKTLECVLKNRTIRLNPLNKMDDLQEEKSKDCVSYGKCVFSSSWSAGDREMIPMWKMYGDDFQGVRIGLPREPFVKYHYSAEEVKEYLPDPPKREIDTYIPMDDLVNKDKDYMFFPAPKGLLHKIDYVDDVEQLEPELWEKFYDSNGAKPIEQWNFGRLGTCKNRYWEFQNEYRYIMYMLPIGFNIFDICIRMTRATHDTRMLLDLMKKVTTEEKDEKLPYYDLHISDMALNNMEIVFGIKTPLEIKKKIEILASKISSNIQIKESALNGLYRLD